MSPEMTAIFLPLKNTLEAREFTVVDILAVIEGFLGSQNIPTAAAFTTHTRRAIEELPDTATVSEVIAESYRRTFFDAEHAKEFGTDYLLNEGMLPAFVDHLVNCYAMDDMQSSMCSNHPATRAD